MGSNIPPYAWVPRPKSPHARGSISKLLDSRTQKKLKTSRPYNKNNGTCHQDIKDFTNMIHIIHPTTNQETKTSTSITSSTKTSNQISTMNKELDNGLKWDQDTT